MIKSIHLIGLGVTVCLALGSFSAHAQMADRLSEQPTMSMSRYSEDDAIAITREMTSRLHLNEGQFLQLMPLNCTKLAGINSINREYKNDRTTRPAKLAELQAQYEQECSRILTPTQLSQLQEDNHVRPANAPANAGNGVG
ncbi:MAG: hypothetical protein NVSMB30_00310 [Hymenobacter sp.]